MAEPGFDDHAQQFGAASPPGLGAGAGYTPPGHAPTGGHPAAGHPAAPPYAGGAYGGPHAGGPHAGGPLGDWLHEAGAAWAGAPPGYAAPGYPTGAAGPSPWITPPHLDAEEPRGRWSLTTAAPWVVAGLLCAVLLTGRDAPAAGAGDLPTQVAVTDAAPVAEGPVAGAPVEAAAPSCAVVTP